MHTYANVRIIPIIDVAVNGSGYSYEILWTEILFSFGHYILIFNDSNIFHDFQFRLPTTRRGAQLLQSTQPAKAQHDEPVLKAWNYFLRPIIRSANS